MTIQQAIYLQRKGINSKLSYFNEKSSLRNLVGLNLSIYLRTDWEPIICSEDLTPDFDRKYFLDQIIRFAVDDGGKIKHSNWPDGSYWDKDCFAITHEQMIEEKWLRVKKEDAKYPFCGNERYFSKGE